MTNKDAKYWVDQLSLELHPEGGYYKETYRSNEQLFIGGTESKRNISTGIYFLLTHDTFSAFHRIKSDEMWHSYSGDPLEIFVFQPDGDLKIVQLGLDFSAGQVPQAVVPANCWFASRVKRNGRFSLVGCTVAPGFDFEDFEMADRHKLQTEYPQHTALIESLTRV
ncbi:MAG: cupin domain-containing protein [Reichenbachiella sp.]|uniref:cupin domain-containing protein n=1 Tax=Reichenbachiella sp. TaxID=2184521 RepID=UPI003263B43D